MAVMLFAVVAAAAQARPVYMSLVLSNTSGVVSSRSIKTFVGDNRVITFRARTCLVKVELSKNQPSDPRLETAETICIHLQRTDPRTGALLPSSEDMDLDFCVGPQMFGSFMPESIFEKPLRIPTMIRARGSVCVHEDWEQHLSPDAFYFHNRDDLKLRIVASLRPSAGLF